MQKFMFIFICLVFVGCTVTNNDNTAWVRMQGMSVNELLRQWGVPTRQVSLADGLTHYIYRTSRLGQRPATASPNVVTVTGNGQIVTAPNEVIAGDVYLSECVTTFVVNKNGIIVGAISEGNGCT